MLPLQVGISTYQLIITHPATPTPDPGKGDKLIIDHVFQIRAAWKIFHLQ